MANSWNEKVVLITGGARGIGAETARQLIARGARVALLDSDGVTVKQTAADLGERAIGFEADVTDVASLKEAVRGTVERFGGIDAVVANAGIIGPTDPVDSVDPAAFEQVIDVNLLGVWRTVRAALPYVIERNGYVLPVASVAALMPFPTIAAYGASKAGVEAFGRALRVELAPDDVAVGVAYFGAIDTDMLHEARATPGIDAVLAGLPGLRRTVPASEAAAAIVRGIERRSGQVYAPGWVPALLALSGPLAWFDGLAHRLPVVARMLTGER